MNESRFDEVIRTTYTQVNSHRMRVCYEWVGPIDATFLVNPITGIAPKYFNVPVVFEELPKGHTARYQYHFTHSVHRTDQFLHVLQSDLRAFWRPIGNWAQRFRNRLWIAFLIVIDHQPEIGCRWYMWDDL